MVRLFLICLLAGQAIAIDFYKPDGRFYPGEPRPAGEVALFVGDVMGSSDVCPTFRALTEAGKPAKMLFGGKTLA